MGKVRKILIIEDDPDFAELVCDQIREIEPKAEVHMVSTVAEAFEKLKSSVFWGIISDIRLPDMSGIEFLQKTKDFRQGSATRTLVLSAFIPSEIAKQEYPGTLFRLKPVKHEELLVWLAS